MSSRNSMARANRQAWVLYAVVVLVVLAIGVPFLLDHNRSRSEERIVRDNQDQTECIQRWADATSDRSALLQRYLLPRSDAQVAFEIAIADGAPKVTIDRLRTVFIARAQEYQDAQNRNPLPVPPRLLCAAAVRKLETPQPRTPAAIPGAPTRPATSGPPPSSAVPTPSPSTRPTQTSSRTVSRERPSTPQTSRTAARPSTRPVQPSTRPVATPKASTAAPGLLGVIVGGVCILPLPVLCPTRSEKP